MRLIDADALKKKVQVLSYDDMGGETWHVVEEKDIDEAPTIEPDRPHGEWIAQDECKAYFMCTNCGYIADADYLRKWKFHTYDAEFPTACLKCGADMRKEGENK